MKLSNKILLGFFGFLFLYLNAAFMEIRLTGSPNEINDENSIAERVDLPGITYLDLSGLEKAVIVTGSDQALLEVRSINGDVLKKLKYAISGDTLTLSGIDAEEMHNFKITVFVPSTSFNAIRVNDAFATVKGLQTSLLSIDQTAGRIFLKDCSIAKLVLDLNAAYLNVAESRVDSVSLTLKKSTLDMYAPLIHLQGSIKDQSLLHLGHAQEIQLKKDESSNVSMYTYQ